MSDTWRLKRTAQCQKCPWLVGVDPHDIPNGYSEDKHRALECAIADPGSMSGLHAPMIHVMACHEVHDAECLGWLANQIGRGNNIPLRIRMMGCENSKDIRLLGEQHESFEDTLP